MAVTILEALGNADMNLQNAEFIGSPLIALAKAQLHNALTLLEKGYSINDEVEPLLEKYGEVENVPEK